MVSNDQPVIIEMESILPLRTTTLAARYSEF
jgi:hypothetical protein